MGDMGRKGLLMLSASLGWALALGLFAVSTNLYLALALVAVVGLFSTVYLAMTMTLLQLATSPEMRGRVMSLMMMTFGLMPLGVFPMSILAESIGIGLAILIGAVGLGLMTISMGIGVPTLRRIDKGYGPSAAMAVPGVLSQ
jgi:MFS family permease